KAWVAKCQTVEGGLEYVWQTSWGVTTRLIGGLVMTHSDDAGLVLPPRLAPVQVAIIPIFRKGEERAGVFAAGEAAERELVSAGVRVTVDRRDELRPGAKHFEWERK